MRAQNSVAQTDDGQSACSPRVISISDFEAEMQSS